MAERSKLWIALIVVHLCRLFILFVAFYFESHGSWYYFMSLRNWYLMFFIVDLIILFGYWFMKPMWEEGIRAFGFFWIMMYIVFIWGISQGQFVLLDISIVEMGILAWPKLYIFKPVENQLVDGVTDSFRLKCASCGAIYSYGQDSIINGQVTCQNCGKLQST